MTKKVEHNLKVAYYTLGCKVNQYDTANMRELMEANGYQTVAFEDIADVYVVNTCTVTNIADRKSRQMIRKGKLKNPDALVCVCGCLAQHEAKALLSEQEINAVLGTANRGALPLIVSRLLSGEDKINAVKGLHDTEGYETEKITKSEERVRANLKICDGCQNYCSYCIIPYTRGPVRSKGIKEIKAEALALMQSGVKEIVLTGIHIASYGTDMGGANLMDVVEMLAEIEGVLRIRLGSLEPSLLQDAFLNRAKDIKKLCPHFHVSLQSGSEEILKKMNRKYTAKQYLEYIENVRNYFHDPAITTDIITGFPGESEQNHAETMALIEKIAFSKIHVFPYSERKGTAAADMKPSVPHPVRKKRARQVMELGAKLHQVYMENMVGQIQQVLVERVSGQNAFGHTSRYIGVIIKKKLPCNEMADVKITGILGENLVGEIQ